MEKSKICQSENTVLPMWDFARSRDGETTPERGESSAKGNRTEPTKARTKRGMARDELEGGRFVGREWEEKEVESTGEGTLGRDAFIWASAAEGSRAVTNEVGRGRRR